MKILQSEPNLRTFVLHDFAFCSLRLNLGVAIKASWKLLATGSSKRFTEQIKAVEGYSNQRQALVIVKQPSNK